MSDRQNLVANAAPFAGAGADLEAGTLDGSRQSAPQQGIFQQSSHPTALFFHLFFRTAAILTYLFCWIFTDNFVLQFVIIVLLLAFDFWTVKNISGRLLVGLRWWNEIKEDGSNQWIFESRENRIVNATDSRIFWFSLYAAPVVWGILAFVALILFKFTWLPLPLVAMSMSMANVIGYTKCEKDAKQKVTSYIAGQSTVQGFVGGFISNRIGNLFGGR
ncbi:Golgi apparatus membrane protein TVP23 A [Gaertneriomyces sp. JEL0708]|nr:Golgi apparatus membrane protein TVP23 A [Gaertneriomyces sp. JEL0708]